MQTITTIGLDIAKSVFQVHGVDAERDEADMPSNRRDQIDRGEARVGDHDDSALRQVARKAASTRAGTVKFTSRILVGLVVWRGLVESRKRCLLRKR
jgi:hypothetical protein